MPEKEKAKYEKKAAADKLRYQEEMKHYVPSEEYEDAGGGKKKKAKRDPNQPKRNMSAYFLYSVAIRPEVKEQNPEASFGDLAKIISAQFKALPASERAKWDAKAVTDKERYVAEMEGKSRRWCLLFLYLSFAVLYCFPISHNCRVSPLPSLCV